MFGINNLLNKLKSKNATESSDSSKQPSNNKIQNWYDERYDTIVVQRNVFILLSFVLLCLSIAAVVVVAYMIHAKRFDPFVIQIDNATGVAQIVNPVSKNVLTANEALSKYFIKKYIIARETYNPVDFDSSLQQIIRLFSSNNVYRDYKGYIKDPVNDPLLKYGQKNTTYLTVRSWSVGEDDQYWLRFSITETAGNKNKYNKIAKVKFDYVPMERSEEQSDINPVGFQVIGYRVDDDNS